MGAASPRSVNERSDGSDWVFCARRIMRAWYCKLIKNKIYQSMSGLIDRVDVLEKKVEEIVYQLSHTKSIILVPVNCKVCKGDMIHVGKISNITGEDVLAFTLSSCGDNSAFGIATHDVEAGQEVSVLVKGLFSGVIWRPYTRDVIKFSVEGSDDVVKIRYAGGVLVDDVGGINNTENEHKGITIDAGANRVCEICVYRMDFNVTSTWAYSFVTIQLSDDGVIWTVPDIPGLYRTKERVYPFFSGGYSKKEGYGNMLPGVGTQSNSTSISPVIFNTNSRFIKLMLTSFYSQYPFYGCRLSVMPVKLEEHPLNQTVASAFIDPHDPTVLTDDKGEGRIPFAMFVNSTSSTECKSVFRRDIFI